MRVFIANIDKLHHDGWEEQQALRIEQGNGERFAEHLQQGAFSSMAFGFGSGSMMQFEPAFTQQHDAQIGQVCAAGQLQRVK